MLQDIWQVVSVVEDIAWMSIRIGLALLQEDIYIWSCVKRVWIAPFYRLLTTLSVFSVLGSAFGLLMTLDLYVPDIRWILSFMAKIWTSWRSSLFRTYQSTSIVVWSTIDRKVSTLAMWLSADVSVIVGRHMSILVSLCLYRLVACFLYVVPVYLVWNGGWLTSTCLSL